ncbi:MAG: ABC transporter ATP-binding protein [Armatimonadota bacterium]|nr:ABC transporter ATP-binding protein [Armatimonadota bacterium]
MTQSTHNGAVAEATRDETPGEAAIEVTQLVKRFGKTPALQNLSLRVPRGSVYALLGRNGAGKSTLIQLLLGLLEPTAGDVRVLGLDPIRDGVELRQRLGYIPERLPLYEWMTVAETLRFAGAQYRAWSAQTEADLVQTFHLDRTKRVRELSRGQRALLALVLAMAHDPELVLLDECTSGMDAIARTEFDRSVIDSLQRAGRTVLFASHQIRELERLCDWVGVLHEGRLLLQMPVDALKESVKLLRLRLPEGVTELPLGPNVLEQRPSGRDWLATVRDFDPASARNALPPDAQLLEVIDLSLEEIFVALLKGVEP